MNMPTPDMSRRRFVARGLAVTSLLMLAPGLVQQAMAQRVLAAPARKLAFLNLHTGERCAVTYWRQGAYCPEALAGIQQVLRDHRSGEAYPMDTALLDQLHLLQQTLETGVEFEVISGYRSPATNAAMHAASNGVARNSLHMQGKAIDIRVPGRSLTQLHQASLSLRMGGVGYYPASDFVHVDSGTVRQWQG